MMNQYAYLFLGVLLGAAIVTYLWISREEKNEIIENCLQNFISEKS